MAATAEQLGECIGFDKHYYETQRRLSLAPEIGMIALEPHIAGIETRRRHEVMDGIAEAIPGVVENTRRYRLEDGILVAENGQNMEELLQNGFSHAMKESAKDSFFIEFRPARARHELDETRLWQQMSNENTTYNTLVVWSPYSEEYCTQETTNKLKEAGQEPESKRAMLKIAHWDGSRLNVHIRSIDNSSIELIKKANHSVNGYLYKAENSTDMLGERQEYTMTVGEVHELADNLVRAADSEITKILGEETKQGRPINEAHDVQKHVESESQIIDNLILKGREAAFCSSSYDDYETEWHALLHSHTALIKQRMLRGNKKLITDVDKAAGTAGAIASARGETYNMCGLIISAGGKSSSTETSIAESVISLIGKKVTCPECKEKVVAVEEKLKRGRLCCPDCKYDVDICTGQVHSTSKKTEQGFKKNQHRGVYELATESIRDEMAQIDYSIAVRREKKQLEMLKGEPKA